MSVGGDFPELALVPSDVLGGAVSVFAALLGLVALSRAPKAGRRFGSLALFGVGIAAAVIGALIAPLIAKFVWPVLVSERLPITTVASGLTIGLFLFVLREARLDIYGALEIVVAVGTMVVVGARTASVDFAAASIALVGSVYVFVRGMTNLVEGWRKRRATQVSSP